jgi:hypothetical protein
VRFDYLDCTKAALERVLGDTIDFQYQIENACERQRGEVSEIAVHPITPGLSGAAVFLVRRIGGGRGYIPWVVKASDDRNLIIAERENNRRFVQGKLSAAPTLIDSTSSSLLIFEFGGVNEGYAPCTLRSGYSLSSPDALATLMRRIVTSLKTFDQMSDDTMSCVDHMPLVKKLEKFQASKSPLPSDVVVRLCDSWRKAVSARDLFPRIRGTAHGDLNSGNVLFEPGSAASVPVFIDFASTRRSKDNKDYEEGYHLPFWDYAKLERDIQTRLFLKEAIQAKLKNCTIIDEIRAVNGVVADAAQTECESVAKLSKTTLALREAVQKEYAPAHFVVYRAVLAYAMLTVLFREQPDAEVQDLQYLVAAESSIALLEDLFSALPPSPSQLKLEERKTLFKKPTLEDTKKKYGPKTQSVFERAELLAQARRVGVSTWIGSDRSLLGMGRDKSVLRWVFASLIIAALSVIVWHWYAGHRAHQEGATSSKPDAAATSHSRQMQQENPSAVALGPPAVPSSGPSADRVAQPPWEDIRSRVQKGYPSFVKLEKSGPFLCTRAPDQTIQIWDWSWQPYTSAADGVTCRQDVEGTQQRADKALELIRVAVLYIRQNGHWQFSKFADRPMASDH